jgi:phage terminase large subunit-like protein
MSGTGVIPGATVGAISWGQGVADLVDMVRIKHVSGGWSDLGFKAFEQGRGAFEGTAKDIIWLDEECPMDVYGECLIRTTTTRGMVILTFTPLEGITPLVKSFIMPDSDPEFSAGD